VKHLLTLLLLAAAAIPARAQVGTLPANSPYRDFSFGQDFTVFGGRFGGSEGKAGVGPRASAIVGVRYGLHISGPAEFSVRVARASSTRIVLDPTKDAGSRVLGTESDPLYVADAGLLFALTGQKSWHHLVPLAGFGLGLVTSRAGQDVGGYQFGTGFAIQYGAALRYVTSGNLSVRLDWTNYLWQLAYPQSYFRPTATGGAAVLSTNKSSQWTNNRTLTLGVSYIFSR
jgi:hypothetical protein